MNLLKEVGNFYKWIIAEGVDIALPNSDFPAPQGEINLKMLHANPPQRAVLVVVRKQQ